jgi:hypothetical protein
MIADDTRFVLGGSSRAKDRRRERAQHICGDTPKRWLIVAHGLAHGTKSALNSSEQVTCIALFSSLSH